MKALLTTLAVLVLPSAALAWETPRDTHNPESSPTQNCALRPGESCVYDFNTETDSKWLGTNLCGSISMHFDPDYDGTNTGATIHIRESSLTTLAIASGDILAVDRDGSGTITGADEVVWSGSVGARGFRNVKPGALYIGVDVTAVAGTPDNSRVTVTCNP